MKVYTSYYGNFKKLKKANIVPIGISLGTPKFISEHLDKILYLAPRRDMLGMEYDDYKKLYLERLSKVDWDDVRRLIKQFGQGKDVAFCCYESLKNEDDWCHRTMLAEFINNFSGKEVITEWKEQTEIVEVKKEVEQQKLFE